MDKNIDIEQAKKDFKELLLGDLKDHWWQYGRITYALYQAFCMKYGYEWGFDLGNYDIFWSCNEKYEEAGVGNHFMKGNKKYCHRINPYGKGNPHQVAKHHKDFQILGPIYYETLFDKETMYAMYPEKKREEESRRMSKFNSSIMSGDGIMTSLQGIINKNQLKNFDILIRPSENGDIEWQIMMARHESFLNLLSNSMGKGEPTSIKWIHEEYDGLYESFINFDGTEFIIPIELDDSRKEEEIENTQEEIDRIEKQLIGIYKKLENKGFTDKAPPHIVENEMKKRDDMETKIEILKSKLSKLK